MAQLTELSPILEHLPTAEQVRNRLEVNVAERRALRSLLSALKQVELVPNSADRSSRQPAAR